MRPFEGENYATVDEVEGRAPIAESGDLGCHPVGPDCAKVLRAAGVHVFEWKVQS